LIVVKKIFITNLPVRKNILSDILLSYIFLSSYIYTNIYQYLHDIIDNMLRMMWFKKIKFKHGIIQIKQVQYENILDNIYNIYII